MAVQHTGHGGAADDRAEYEVTAVHWVQHTGNGGVKLNSKMNYGFMMGW